MDDIRFKHFPNLFWKCGKMKVFKKAFFGGYESYRSISEAVKYFQTL